MKRLKKNEARIRYEIIYDKACKYLDSEFEKGLCEFENDKCGAAVKFLYGCCKQYKNKLFAQLLPWNKLVICEYLKNKKCSVQCISCKLYTCRYLQKKGIRFRAKDIEILKEFNIIQRYIIDKSLFVPKEKIMKRLIFWR